MTLLDNNPYFDTSKPLCKQSRRMSSFVPRPFPPPSLSGVPLEYIIDQLQNLAPLYWNKPESADCTIIVPVPHPQGRSKCTPESKFPPETLPSASTNGDLPGRGRRATEPSLHFSPRISLKLHMDYLSAHSSYLRGLFSGASPLDLINSKSGSPTAVKPPTRTSSGQFTIPPNRLPRLIPSSPSHPILFLPVPDPTSFHLLVHWMYFGNTNYIEDCLNQGIIQWEGIARNVEYLGLPASIKVFLGRWYGSWLHPERARPSRNAYSDDDCSDDDDDGTDTDIDDEPTYYDSATTSETEAGLDEDEDSDDEKKEPQRGRTRTTRFLASAAAARYHSA